MTSRVFGIHNKLGQSFLMLLYICEQCHWYVMGRVCAAENCSRGCKLGQNPRSVVFSGLCGMLCQSYRQYEGREGVWSLGDSVVAWWEVGEGDLSPTGAAQE